MLLHNLAFVIYSCSENVTEPGEDMTKTFARALRTDMIIHGAGVLCEGTRVECILCGAMIKDNQWQYCKQAAE